MEEKNTVLSRPMSRRTAIKAAVAVGAVAYAIPAVETITGTLAHAGASTRVTANAGLYLQTCGAAARYGAAGAVTISPLCGTSKNSVSLSDTGFSATGSGSNVNLEAGVDDVQFVMYTSGGDQVRCTIDIQNVLPDCSATGVQYIQVTCTDLTTHVTVYATPVTQVTGGKIVNAVCP